MNGKSYFRRKLITVAISATALGAFLGAVVTWRSNSAKELVAVQAKKAVMPLITRLNFPTQEAEEDAMWNVSTDGDAALPVVRRSKEVRAVLKKRPAASEEQGGMPSPLRERLEGGGFDSIAELLPLYQQWGLRNGPAAAEDAQSRAASLNSDKPLISVFHGWMMADKHGPESWVNSFDGTIEQKAVLESALRSTRGY